MTTVRIFKLGTGVAQRTVETGLQTQKACGKAGAEPCCNSQPVQSLRPERGGEGRGRAIGVQSPGTGMLWNPATERYGDKRMERALGALSNSVESAFGWLHCSPQHQLDKAVGIIALLVWVGHRTLRNVGGAGQGRARELCSGKGKRDDPGI